jgi:Holliday junction resolvasome RuvABC endonuclease subunit
LTIGLGLDVATSCGCAVVMKDGHFERMLDHWTADLSGAKCSTWSTIAAILSRVAGHCPPNELVVAIELPYLDENVHTLQVLARFCGRLEQVMEAAGAQVVFANAQSWQRAILGRFGGRVRADRKKAAAIWARAVFGPGLLPDEADAAGLVTHVLRQRGFAAKVAKAVHV